MHLRNELDLFVKMTVEQGFFQGVERPHMLGDQFEALLTTFEEWLRNF